MVKSDWGWPFVYIDENKNTYIYIWYTYSVSINANAVNRHMIMLCIVMWNPDLLSKLGAFVQPPTPFCKNRCLFVPSLRPSDLDRLKQGGKGGQTGCWPVCSISHMILPKTGGHRKIRWFPSKRLFLIFQHIYAYLGAFLFVEVKILLIGQWILYNRVHHQAEMVQQKQPRRWPGNQVA